MTVLILLISLLLVFVLLAVLYRRNEIRKRLNYRDRAKLERLLEDSDQSATIEFTVNNEHQSQILEEDRRYEEEADPFNQPTDLSDKYYRKGLSLIETSPRDAINLFSKAIELNKSEPALYYYRGIAKVSINMHADAIFDFTNAMVLKFTNPEVHFQRGKARLKTGDKKGALLDFTDYVSVIKTNPEAYYNKGTLELEFENYKTALIDFNSAILLNPNHEYAYFMRGLAKQKLGDTIGSCSDFTIAFEKGCIEAFHYKKEYCR